MTITMDILCDMAIERATTGKSTKLLKSLDRLKKTFPQKLKSLLYDSKDQTIQYSKANIIIANQQGFLMLQIELSNGDWFVFKGRIEDETDFGLSGCNLKCTTLEDCFKFVNTFSKDAHRLLEKAR